MPPKGIAVVAGVTEFPDRINRGLPELTHPEQSAKWIAEFARTTLRYKVPEPLLGKDAKVCTWKKAVRDAIGELGRGDALLLSFAGHGSHSREIETCIPGSYQETWCFHDHDLVDKDIRKILSEVPKDIRVFVVADCCFAGGVTLRFNNERTGEIRQLNPDSHGKLRNAARAVHELAAWVWRLLFGDRCNEPQARVLVVASCGENETGKDGCFMDAMKAALTATPYPTFDQLFDRMQKSIPVCSSTQTPQPVPLGQKKPSLLSDHAFKI